MRALNEDSDPEFYIDEPSAPSRFISPESVDRHATSLKLDGREVELDESQSAAVRLAAKHKLLVITGQAGAGKSFVIAAIANLFAEAGIPVGLVAPTGKAARRMTEATGREAATIHRTLGYSREGRFVHGPENPLGEGLWVVDECSMTSSDLLYRFLSAMPGKSSVILVGDHEQLPPVDAGAPLRDILNHNLAPIVRLDKVHRSAGTLRRNCRAILDGVVEKNCMTPDSPGGPPPWFVHRGLHSTDDVVDATKSMFSTHLAKWGFNPINDVQFLSPMHKGPIGVKRLNKMLQWLHQKSIGNSFREPQITDEMPNDYYEQDKIIQMSNDYDLDLFNGTVGVVKEISNKEICADFEGREVVIPKDKWGNLDLAYCISCHKSQGSGFPCSVTICHKSQRFMWNRSLLYTSCTRAIKTSAIIGDGETADMAANKIETNRRTTLISVVSKAN